MSNTTTPRAWEGRTDCALVRERREDIDRLDRRLAALLEAKDEVDPAVQVGADVLRLQGLGSEELAPTVSDEGQGKESHLAVQLDEASRVALRPRWQGDIVDRLVVLLPSPQLLLVDVDEELGQVEEFGRELADVAAVLPELARTESAARSVARRWTNAPARRLPRSLDAPEETVGVVVGAALEIEERLGKGREADKVPRDGHG